MTASNAALNQKVGQAVADKMNEQHGRNYKFGDCQVTRLLRLLFGTITFVADVCVLPVDAPLHIRGRCWRLGSLRCQGKSILRGNPWGWLHSGGPSGLL